MCTQEHPELGEFAVLFYGPEIVPPGDFQVQVKRLVTRIPPWAKFPWNEPGWEVSPVLMVEMLNPRRRFMVDYADLLAVHKATARCRRTSAPAAISEGGRDDNHKTLSPLGLAAAPLAPVASAAAPEPHDEMLALLNERTALIRDIEARSDWDERLWHRVTEIDGQVIGLPVLSAAAGLAAMEAFLAEDCADVTDRWLLEAVTDFLRRIA